MSIFAPEKLLVVAILALLVLGPNRLPGAARSAGRVIGQLRRMSGSFQTEVRDALAEPREVLQHAVEEFGLGDLNTSVRKTFSPLAFDPLPKSKVSTSPTEASPTVAPAAGQRGVDEAVASSSLEAASGPGQLPVPDDPSLN